MPSLLMRTSLFLLLPFLILAFFPLSTYLCVSDCVRYLYVGVSLI